MPQPYDDDTWLPPLPMATLERRLAKFSQLRYQYLAHYHTCLEEGFTFVDWNGDSLASTAKIVENASDGMGDDLLLQPWSEAGWVDFSWVPVHSEDPLQGDLDFAGAIGRAIEWGSSGPIEHSEAAWYAAVFEPGPLGHAVTRAWAGIAIRYSIRWVQLRGAMNARNLFRLDERGRPEGS